MFIFDNNLQKFVNILYRDYYFCKYITCYNQPVTIDQWITEHDGYKTPKCPECGEIMNFVKTEVTVTDYNSKILSHEIKFQQ